MTSSSMETNVGKPEIYEVAGSVKTVYYGNRNDPAKFDIITTESKTKYHVTCNFFCPVQIGDVAYLLVEKTGDNLNVIRQPFVQIPDNRNSICQSFYRSPIGKSINHGSIEVLYERLRELGSLSGFGPKYTSMISRPLNKTIGSSSSQSLGSSTSVSTTETKRYKGDGVSAYLSDLAYRFNRSRDDTILLPIVSETHFTVENITKLVEWWHKNWTLRRLYLLGLTNYEINACHLSHDEIYDQCIENPFKLAPISIDKCISILSSMNRPTENERKTFEAEKFCGEIVRKIYSHLNSGWIGTPLWILKKEYPQAFTALAPYLCQNYKVVIEHDTVYLHYPHKVEKFVAEYINKLIIASATAREKELLDEKNGSLTRDSKINAVDSSRCESTRNDQKIQSEVDSKEARIDTKHCSIVPSKLDQPYLCSTLTQEQKNAILGALKHKICIVSGGAGTGKTKIIGEIVNNLKIRGIKCITCSFTGKAVARLQFFLKDASYTMDRLICRYKGMQFDHLIIDECSMVTTELFYRFIMAFPGNYSITLVGDINQLPPIGWGTMMRELIATKRIPTYMLTLNQRIIQHHLDTTNEPIINSDAAPSEEKFKRVILENADRLIDPTRSLARSLKFIDGDGFYQLEGDTDVIEKIIHALHDQKISTDRFAIICPYKEPLKNLNEIVQYIYFKPPNNISPPSELSKHYRDKKGHLWCVGDRVMMLGNNYGINVMNGDEGTLMSIDCKGVVVRFKDGADHLFLYEAEKQRPGNKSENKEEDHWAGDELTIDQITQSFAATIHKMQGSEYEFIILYIPRRSLNKEIKSNFININLLYTGITRTRRSIWIVGDTDTIEAATTKTVPKRMDNLCKRLTDMKDNKVDALLSEFQPKEIPSRKEVEITSDDIPQEVDDERYEELYRN